MGASSQNYGLARLLRIILLSVCWQHGLCWSSLLGTAHHFNVSWLWQGAQRVRASWMKLVRFSSRHGAFAPVILERGSCFIRFGCVHGAVEGSALKLRN